MISPQAALVSFFSVELACFSLATLPAYLWLRRANVRTVTILCTVLVVLGNLLSAWTTSFEALLVIRALTSLAAGSITVILLSLSGKTSNPSRAYGIFVVTQLAMGAVILLVFPALYAGKTAASVYLTIAILMALTLPAAWCVQGHEFKRRTKRFRPLSKVHPRKISSSSVLRSSPYSVFILRWVGFGRSWQKLVTPVTSHLK
ncbi:MAG TPA: MFS transporter [Enteractinococcus sp.]